MENLFSATFAVMTTSPSTRARRERRLSSWPPMIARYVPLWVPWRFCQTLEMLASWVVAIPFAVSFILWDIFGNTDIWGVRRDRAKEKRERQEWKDHYRREKEWSVQPLFVSGKKEEGLWKILRGKVEGWWSDKPTRGVPTLKQKSDQLQSPLCCLPPELLELIYAHLIPPSKRLHIQESYQRFGFVECILADEDEPTPCTQPFMCLERHIHTLTGRFDSIPSQTSRLDLSSYAHLTTKPKLIPQVKPDCSPDPPPKNRILALAKTCKLLSSGYINTLYSNSTFAFTSLNQFHTFSTTIPRTSLDRITSLEFTSELSHSTSDRNDLAWSHPLPPPKVSEWIAAWNGISKMEGLKGLRVDLRMDRVGRRPKDDTGGAHDWQEERIFEPMKRVEQCKVFEVEVNWPGSEAHVWDEEVPFGLVRDLGRDSWVDVRRGW